MLEKPRIYLKEMNFSLILIVNFLTVIFSKRLYNAYKLTMQIQKQDSEHFVQTRRCPLFRRNTVVHYEWIFLLDE